MFIKTIISCFCFLLSTFVFAQKLERIQSAPPQQGIDTTKVDRRSTSNKGLKNENATIDQYLVISHKNDTTFVDTTLTIKKEFKFNYLRKDNFELIPFSNLGQTYNSLSKNIYDSKTLPEFGARARHFNYMEIEDINYYHVPTPLTEILFKTAFQQGQLLDAFFTVNTSKQFNFSLAYKGLRSLGNYQHILTSTGNFRFTTNYTTKNKRYTARFHMVTQDLLNQENGGLTDEDVVNFQSGEEDFIDRSVFDPIFEDAESMLRGKRFHLEHQYAIKSIDSLSKYDLKIGNIISFEDKYFQYDQTMSNEVFGESFVDRNIRDRVTQENFHARLYGLINSNVIGSIQFNLDYHDYNYGYDQVTLLSDGTIIKNRIKDNTVSIGGSYKKEIKKVDLGVEAGLNVSGQFDGNFISANAGYQITDGIKIQAALNYNSSAPNFNFLLFQNEYINYNWDNSNTFDNVQTSQLKFIVDAKKIGTLTVDYTNTDNYVYFAEQGDNNLVKPVQSKSTINYLRVKASKEFKYGKFALNNTIMYQEVPNGDNVINVPQLITRNTLYYANHFFKDALYLQTGVTLNYFTEYNMDAYDPILAEFYTQNETKLGNFPRLDFFINAKIRQTRIFLKAEHFNAAFTGYDYFSAPNYPYRDFAVRFGLVWNFFL
ncbi:putative porin [uncultured Psychroserpens sp.]|uniref:putative porin n=1 Tax=uncultured Psychroserpens sp. TaxID=255436 RepID=UPI0026086079|nr:putative porin [uncultured Psychroserpens sp.]